MLVFSSCVILTPHENFKHNMQANIGNKVDDPSSVLMRYRQYVYDSKVLKNGNIETEYRPIIRCRVFFEIDVKTNIIIGWRFEGDEKDCIIVP